MILEVNNVSKSFTGHQALKDVSLSVPTGKVYGLLGPNGAGKTTLLRIINHITTPDSGEVIFDGRPLTAESVVNIGYLPEERGLYKKMKVGDQALYFARLRGLSKQEALQRLHSWFERFDIMDWWNKRVEELSKGMAQKVQFIVTVVHEPKMLIFDEPFSGFDPINANLLKEEILRMKNAGATIIFSTHNMMSVEEICDDISLINNGKIVLSGNVEQLRSSWFDRCYDVTFAGADHLPEGLLLDGAIESIRAIGPGNATVRLREDSPEMRHRLIADLNEAVDITSLQPAKASMNEIFIRTVGQDNMSNPTTNSAEQQ